MSDSSVISYSASVRARRSLAHPIDRRDPRVAALKDVLDKRGTLGEIKAKIRSEVFHAIDDSQVRHGKLLPFATPAIANTLATRSRED